MNVLTGLGYGIITLAIVIGLGIVILAALQGTVATCATGYAWSPGNSTTVCCNVTASSCTGASNSSATTGTASTTLGTMYGYLGTGSGGLASFIPLVIVIVIGLLFLGMFMGKKGKSYA